MKVNFLKLRNYILVFITGLILSSCSKSSTSADDIVGTWTGGATSVSAMVGTMTLTQYFTTVVGLNATLAAQYTSIFTAQVQQSLTGSVQIKSDGTYTSTLGGSTDTGTWSLSSDNKTLTIDSNTLSALMFNVIELTSSKLQLTLTETSSEDLNSDGTPETITDTINATFTK